MEFKKTLLESKKTDKEILELLQDPSFTQHPFVKSWMKNYEKALKEGEIEIGTLRGQTVADAVNAANVGAGLQVYATLEIFNAVVRGFTRYMDDSFVKKYTTESVVFKVPKTEYRELVAAISGGQLPHTEKIIDYATVDLSNPESEKGGKVTWTRSLLEDITFDVQAEMAEGLGHAIAVKMMSDILDTVVGVPTYKEPMCANVGLSTPISWTEFLSIIGAVDTGMRIVSFGFDTLNTTAMNAAWIGYQVYNNTDSVHRIGTLVDWSYSNGAGTGVMYVLCAGNVSASTLETDFEDGDTIHIRTAAGSAVATAAIEEDNGAFTSYGLRTYGPADFCLVSPDVYWELLNIIQMTNVLYEGSTDPVKRGVIKLALGTTIVKQGLLDGSYCIALNSEKAVALVTRRTLKIEPVLFPVWNEYGFIGTVRYGITRIYDHAIQIGTR